MKRILLVDDEPHVLRVLRMALERAGYTVDDAANGEEALTSITSNPPDLMITDIDMPRMTGTELCERIRNGASAHSFPIFVVTARTDPEHRTWASALGDINFLEKPVSVRRLTATLEGVFQRATAEESAT